MKRPAETALYSAAVNDSGRTRTGRQRFHFSGKPSVPVLATASSLALFGAIVLIFWGFRGGPLLFWAGAGSMGASVVLAAATFWRTAWSRCVVVLDDDGLTITRGRRSQTLPWAEIDHCARVGNRLEIFTGAGRAASVVNPQGASTRVFTALVAAVEERLHSNPQDWLAPPT
jgi:hypothetical protein